MTQMGIAQPSTLHYNSPMFLVSKKDGGVQVIQYFRALNADSHDDRYSMKNINKCMGDIGRAFPHWISHLDFGKYLWMRKQALDSIYSTRHGPI
jgi:hypothetical protein